MISVFHTRNLCYFSSEFFLDKIEESLEALGESVQRQDIPELSENPDISLLSDISAGDIIFDINSALPRVKTKEGYFWLDKTGAEFYNYILDHPLYHHDSLSVPLNNYHVICLEKSHRDYIKKYYPHIKSVEVLPVPGTSPISTPIYKDRDPYLLFQGSFISPETLSLEVKRLKETYGSLYSKILFDLMDLWDPFNETIETALDNYLKEESMGIDDIDFCQSFPELLNLMFPVDRIKRNIYRENILFRLSDEVPLFVMGTGWEESRLQNTRARIISEETYSVALQKNGKYKFVLDINPFFLGGIHDRVSNGFAAGSLVFSNMKTGEGFGPRPDKAYIRYEGDDISTIVDSINNYDSDMEYISAAGMSYWMDNLTWEKWGKKFLKLLG